MGYHLATLALLRLGGNLDALASHFGVTRTTVSRWLGGRHPAPAGFDTALSRVVGPDGAKEIRSLITQVTK